MWLLACYAAFILHKTPGFSWRAAWRGESWTSREVRLVIIRFLVSTLGIVLLTLLIEPEHFFSFPTQRPFFWFLVMILYPLLSALPQELVFRTFFFRRYATLFPQDGMMLTASAFVFGFIHIVFHNPVSPLLSLLCGFFLAGSYFAHKSLKRAALEHALYGDMVFTVGLGYYFLVGHYS
jgi:membrane protease YdiL (CAAX protease family)